MQSDFSITFDWMKEQGFVPQDSGQFTKDEVMSNCISMSEFTKLSTQERVGLNNKRVIADNAVWVCGNSKVMTSVDNENFVWRTSKLNRMITKYQLAHGENGKFELHPVAQTSLIKNKDIIKEDFKMATNDIASLLDNLEENDAKVTGVASLNTFTGDDKEAAKERRKDIAEKLDTTISKNVSNVQMADATELATFNRLSGFLVGYLTNTDKKIAVSTPKRPVLQNGMKQLVSTAEQSVIEAFAKGEKVAEKHILKAPTLELKEFAPSGIAGVVYTMPKGGVVPISAFSKTGPIEFDKTNKDLVTLVHPKDQFMTTALYSFGGKIKEDPRTHGGESKTVTVALQASFSKKLQTHVAKFVMSIPDGRRQVIDTNYIPRKVFKTMPLSAIVNGTPDVKQEANKSLFFNIFAPKPTTSSIFERLDTASKKLVKKDGETYSSELLETGNVSIKRFFNSELAISNPAIPLKSFEMKKDKSGETGRYITYDVLKPTAELEELNPQTSGEFAPMVNVLTSAGMTVRDAFAGVVATKASTSKKSSRRTLLGNEALGLLMNSANNGLVGMTIEGFTQSGFTKLQEEMANIAFGQN